MPSWLEIFAETLPDVFVHVVNYLDVASLRALHRALPALGRGYSSFGAVAPQLLEGAIRDFEALMECKPTPSLPLGSPLGRAFELQQLRVFHQVVQVVLDGVNRVKGDEAELNVLTGEDLLYTVGRLSMMINDVDYLPSDTRPIPLNWTSDKFLREREQLQPEAIPRILDQLSSSGGSQHAPTIPFTNYHRDAGYRIYEILRRQLAGQLHGGVMPIRWNPADLWLLTSACSFLNSDDASQAIRALAVCNKRFLVLTSTAAPESLLTDPLRCEAVVSMALKLGRVLSRSAGLLENTSGSRGYSLTDLVKARRNQLVQQIVLLQKGLTDAYKKLELVKWARSRDFRNLALPWGGGHQVALAYAGSVRLVFSQALSIMHEIGDRSSAALDLSYERIVDYLDMLPRRTVTDELAQALANPVAVRNAFFGELAILLVGIEGSQNNLTVMQAPMCMDLVACGQLTWAQVLFERRDIPFFVMGADKTEKGLQPLVRHGQILKNQSSERDRQDPSWSKFENFLQRELDLNLLFFKVFFPRLSTYPARERLILSALCLARYLALKFNLGPKATRIIFGNVARILAPLTGKRSTGSSGSDRSGSGTSSREPVGSSGEPRVVPSPSGQVYPVEFGLPEFVNRIATPYQIAEWYDRAETSRPVPELLEWLDRVITHLDWQVAELEPDPYERQEFANRVKAYAGPSRDAYETWKLFKRFTELRREITPY
ncbi:MAG TPA: hypothetical protein VGD37_23805 [Kofleriaceae bacterium]|jgi:hypothetical protein